MLPSRVLYQCNKILNFYPVHLMALKKIFLLRIIKKMNNGTGHFFELGHFNMYKVCLNLFWYYLVKVVRKKPLFEKSLVENNSYVYVYDFPQKNFSMCHGTYSPIPDPSKNWSVNSFILQWVKFCRCLKPHQTSHLKYGMELPSR